MAAGVGDDYFEGSAFDLDTDLPGALRAGLPGLHAAAEATGVDTEIVDAVVSAAWDAFTGFSARHVEGFHEVVDLAIGVHGWAWAEAVLVDPAGREALFGSVTGRARRLAHRLYPRLPAAEREAAADDAMLRLSRLMLVDHRCGFKMTAWTSWTVVRTNTVWRLLDAAERFDNHQVCRGSRLMSLDDYWAAIGEQGLSSLEYGSGGLDDAGVEAAVWSAALADLEAREAKMLENKRSGAARTKLALTIYTAKQVLTDGTRSNPGNPGNPGNSGDSGDVAEEIRCLFAQDPLLVCFRALRTAAPGTWGVYPADKVPTREVIKSVADHAAASGGKYTEWFAKLETRRVEVARKDRLLHGVRRLVEACLAQAAHDDDM